MQKQYRTSEGSIVYWIHRCSPDAPNVVFLPGLTADHRLFDDQITYFSGGDGPARETSIRNREILANKRVVDDHPGKGGTSANAASSCEDAGCCRVRANCLVWDPPSHGASRPFALTWSLDDMARALHGILQVEGFAHPILVGQSMGGFLSQVYMELFPDEVCGFVAIDSAPMKRSYYAKWELAFLHHTHGMYSAIPWSLLLKWGAAGCATTERGRANMCEMMEDYVKSEYVDLAAHGYAAVAQAVETDRAYSIDCPCVLICGSKDSAGSSRRYSRTWAKREGMPLHWIEGAGHNSCVDAPDETNRILEEFIRSSSV